MSEEPELLVEGVQEPEVVEEESPATEEVQTGAEAEGLAAQRVDEVVMDATDEHAETALAEEEAVLPVAEEVVAEAAEEQAGIALVGEGAVSSVAEETVSVAAEEQAEAASAEEESVSPLAAEVAAGPPEEPARQEGRHWYVIHSYSGYENKVKQNLESRIESMGMHGYIFEVVVPTEEVVELRDGHRRTVEQRIFPGYILVDMILNDESWFVVRNTPGVTGFVGSGNLPIPLRQEEADTILRRMEEEAPRVKVSFSIGDSVRIVDGPFTDFMGTVDDLNLEKGKVRLLVSFFGRETPVELDFLQVKTE